MVQGWLNLVLPAQLLVETTNEQRVRLDDAVGDVVLLAVDLVLIRDAQRVRPLIRAVVNTCATFAGEREQSPAMAVHPHGCDLLL